MKFIDITMALAIVLGVTVTANASGEVLCPTEVGSGGVKGRVIDLSYDAQCNMVAKTLFSADENTNIVQSIQQNRFSADAIKTTASAVGKLHSQMQSKFPGCLAMAVGSSGVAMASNTNELKDAVAGYGLKDMTFITPPQEAEYGFKSSVPNRKRGQTVLIDIGGGNTKIGYLDKAGTFRAMDIPFGSSSLAKRAESTGLPLRFGVAKAMMSEVLPKFREDTKTHPEVLNRESVYWIGGVAWATATYARPELADKAVVSITRSNLEEFLIALEKDTWKSKQAPSGMDATTLAAWEKDWASVQKIFPRERLIAGVTLMKVMLSDGVYRESVTFPRYGQWLFGYSVELFKIASASCSR